MEYNGEIKNLQKEEVEKIEYWPVDKVKKIVDDFKEDDENKDIKVAPDSIYGFRELLNYEIV